MLYYFDSLPFRDVTAVLVLERSQRETCCWRAARSCRRQPPSSSTTRMHRACRKVSLSPSSLASLGYPQHMSALWYWAALSSRCYVVWSEPYLFSSRCWWAGDFSDCRRRWRESGQSCNNMPVILSSKCSLNSLYLFSLWVLSSMIFSLVCGFFNILARY